MPRTGRPPIDPALRTRPHGLSLPGGVIDELADLARTIGESQGQIVTRALRSEFKRLRRRYDLPEREDS